MWCVARVTCLVGETGVGWDRAPHGQTNHQGRFRLLPQGDSQGSEKHASLENTLVRFKPDTKKCHTIFC